MDTILDHDGVHGIPLTTFIRQRWRSGVLPSTMLGTVQARINHGRWIVDCPTPGCNSAMLASLKERRYACPDCGKGWWRVVFPDRRVDIEDLLLRRPLIAQLPSSRNWEVAETVADLERENRERGV